MGIIGAQLYITIYSCDHKFRTIEVLLSLLSLLFFRNSYGSGGDANRSFLRYVRFVTFYLSACSFWQITPGWNGTMLKPNTSPKSLAYSKVYYMIRSMYQQQVEPEHGYTTYIMRSLRSPPAQQVSKQLGKMEIKIKKTLKRSLFCIIFLHEQTRSCKMAGHQKT